MSLKIGNLVELDRDNKTIIFPQLGTEFGTNKMLNGSNFNRIKHLNGSKLIDTKDDYMDSNVQNMFIVQKRQNNDMIYITEKIDGMNVGLYKYNNRFYALNRKGYDVRSKLIQENGDINFLFFIWAYWCSEYVLKQSNSNHNIYEVPNGTRFVFENALLTHTLKYNFKHHSPVFLLAIYQDDKRLNIKNVNQLARYYNMQKPPTLSTHCAINPKLITNQYGKGIAGCKEEMEGCVYVYEIFDKNKKDWRIESTAKYVSNPRMGTEEVSPSKFNDWYDMKRYLKLKRTVLEYWYDSKIDIKGE